jgi:hypothetical protein
MKLTTVLVFLVLPVYLFAAPPPDTTIKGIHIRFGYSASIFPESWRAAPVNAQGEVIAAKETERSTAIMVKALNKYPFSVLQKNLTAVHFLKSMSFFDVGYGGTNSTDKVYLTNNGVPQGYTDAYLEQTFHHEFSSILLRNYLSQFDTTAWKAANDSRFSYNDPEDGVGAIRNNASSQELDTAICRRGLLTQYAMSGLENDMNTFAQNLFRPEKNFWAMVDKYAGIRKKTTLLIRFYNGLSPVFSEDYFRKFDKK